MFHYDGLFRFQFTVEPLEGYLRNVTAWCEAYYVNNRLAIPVVMRIPTWFDGHIAFPNIYTAEKNCRADRMNLGDLNIPSMEIIKLALLYLILVIVFNLFLFAEEDNHYCPSKFVADVHLHITGSSAEEVMLTCKINTGTVVHTAQEGFRTKPLRLAASVRSIKFF